MLREMLVMIRIWGLLKPGCLPTFTATSDNQDSMQLLFRLLTKLWLCCENPADPHLRMPLFCDCRMCPGYLCDHVLIVVLIVQLGTTAPPRNLMTV